MLSLILQAILVIVPVHGFLHRGHRKGIKEQAYVTLLVKTKFLSQQASESGKNPEILQLITERC